MANLSIQTVKCFSIESRFLDLNYLAGQRRVLTLNRVGTWGTGAEVGVGVTVLGLPFGASNKDYKEIRGVVAKFLLPLSQESQITEIFY